MDRTGQQGRARQTFLEAPLLRKARTQAFLGPPGWVISREAHDGSPGLVTAAPPPSRETPRAQASIAQPQIKAEAQIEAHPHRRQVPYSWSPRCAFTSTQRRGARSVGGQPAGCVHRKHAHVSVQLRQRSRPVGLASAVLRGAGRQPGRGQHPQLFLCGQCWPSSRPGHPPRGQEQSQQGLPDLQEGQEDGSSTALPRMPRASSEPEQPLLTPRRRDVWAVVRTEGSVAGRTLLGGGLAQHHAGSWAPPKPAETDQAASPDPCQSPNVCAQYVYMCLYKCLYTCVQVCVQACAVCI